MGLDSSLRNSVVKCRSEKTIELMGKRRANIAKSSSNRRGLDEADLKVAGHGDDALRFKVCPVQQRLPLGRVTFLAASYGHHVEIAHDAFLELLVHVVE